MYFIDGYTGSVNLFQITYKSTATVFNNLSI